jgi:hypothetical protein
MLLMNRREALQAALAAAIGSFLPKMPRWMRSAPAVAKVEPPKAAVVYTSMTAQMSIEGPLNIGDVVFMGEGNCFSRTPLGPPIGIAMTPVSEYGTALVAISAGVA